MKRTSLLSLIVIGILSTVTFASAPESLSEAKRNVIQYHDSGQYNKDVRDIAEEATAYLKQRLADPDSFKGKKPAIVLDIDETSLSNYAILAQHSFGGSKSELLKAISRANNPAMAPILQLYKYAKTHHVAVFFVTARNEQMRSVTKNNLKRAGFEDWDKLYMRGKDNHGASVEAYKTAARKEITDNGYDIILNIGDQDSDLAGGYADKTFKLPNPYYS